MVRLVVYDKEAPAPRSRQGHPRAGGLHGRAAADDRQRHLRHQRHRARHRLAAAPFARACSSTTTAARPTPPASCCSPRASFPTAARGSTSSSIRRTACSCASTAAASCRSPILLRALGMTRRARSSTCSSRTNTFYLGKDETCARAGAAAPARRDGDVRDHASASKVIVEEGRRITARHVRELEKAGVKQLAVPRDYLVGQHPGARRGRHRAPARSWPRPTRC